MLSSMAVAALVGTTITYTLYSIITSFLLSRHIQARSKELKCSPPPVFPSKWPFGIGIDNVMRSLKSDKDMLFPADYVNRIALMGGRTTYAFSLLGTKFVTTADEKNIQTILAHNFQDWDIGPQRRGNFWPLLGNGIFTQDGKSWEHSRAMMRPQFSREQVSDLDMEEKHVQNLMRALEEKLNGDMTETVDLSELFFRLTLDAATDFLFGESVGSQVSFLRGNERSTKGGVLDIDFASAFDIGQRSLATRFRFADLYWLVNPKGFKKSCKDCHDFIDHFVRRALSQDPNEKAEKGTGGKERYVFLDALVKETRDPIELRSQLLHTLLAGRDTTASLLGWLFLELSKDPIRYTKLRATILSNFGTYSNPRDITFSTLKSCSYLKDCINEALRLYPVVPLNGRIANKDTVLPRGGGEDGTEKIFVPKGMTCEYSVYAMQRRKDLWGEDADVFKPERWEGRRVGWEFLPFNGGPRICIGQQFALTEASYVTVRLLQRFDGMRNMETDPVIKHNLTLTNCSGNGVKVQAHVAA